MFCNWRSKDALLIIIHLVQDSHLVSIRLEKFNYKLNFVLSRKPNDNGVCI